MKELNENDVEQISGGTKGAVPFIHCRDCGYLEHSFNAFSIKTYPKRGSTNITKTVANG